MRMTAGIYYSKLYVKIKDEFLDEIWMKIVGGRVAHVSTLSSLL